MKETRVEPEVAVSIEAIVGEGAIWDGDKGVLYWLDILGNQLYVFDPRTGHNRAIDVGQAVGTVVPRASGGLMVALHNGFAALDLATEKLTPIADPERAIPANRFNDGKCDPAGRFWAGTMEFNGEPDAARSTALTSITRSRARSNRSPSPMASSGASTTVPCTTSTPHATMSERGNTT